MSFFDGREFEYAETINTHVGLRGTLRVVLVRALKFDHAQGLHAGADYDYAAFTTNIGMHEMKATDVLRKYRKRSNAENFIREMKNGIDRNRFQCRRLVSNEAFGLAAAFAHTILRFVAQIADKTLAQFAKKIAEPPDQFAVHGGHSCASGDVPYVGGPQPGGAELDQEVSRHKVVTRDSFGEVVTTAFSQLNTLAVHNSAKHLFSNAPESSGCYFPL
ncbi:MAG: transposase [Rhodocyclaceae bacterium]|nr:transposase [Rhodocyclaceae bacterium]